MVDKLRNFEKYVLMLTQADVERYKIRNERPCGAHDGRTSQKARVEILRLWL